MGKTTTSDVEYGFYFPETNSYGSLSLSKIKYAKMRDMALGQTIKATWEGVKSDSMLIVKGNKAEVDQLIDKLVDREITLASLNLPPNASAPATPATPKSRGRPGKTLASASREEKKPSASATPKQRGRPTLTPAKKNVGKNTETTERTEQKTSTSSMKAPRTPKTPAEKGEEKKKEEGVQIHIEIPKMRKVSSSAIKSARGSTSKRPADDAVEASPEKKGRSGEGEGGEGAQKKRQQDNSPLAVALKNLQEAEKLVKIAEDACVSATAKLDEIKKKEIEAINDREAAEKHVKECRRKMEEAKNDYEKKQMQERIAKEKADLRRWEKEIGEKQRNRANERKEMKEKRRKAIDEVETMERLIKEHDRVDVLEQNDVEAERRRKVEQIKKMEEELGAKEKEAREKEVDDSQKGANGEVGTSGANSSNRPSNGCSGGSQGASSAQNKGDKTDARKANGDMEVVDLDDDQEDEDDTEEEGRVQRDAAEVVQLE